MRGLWLGHTKKIGLLGHSTDVQFGPRELVDSDLREDLTQDEPSTKIPCETNDVVERKNSEGVKLARNNGYVQEHNLLVVEVHNHNIDPSSSNDMVCGVSPDPEREHSIGDFELEVS